MPGFCQPPLAHVLAPESASVEPLQSIRPRFLGHERMCWTRRVSVRADLGPARRIQPGNLSNVRRQVGIRNRRSYSMSQRHARSADLRNVAASRLLRWRRPLKLVGAPLFVFAEECNHRVIEIFPSLQIFRHPGIPFRNCSVHFRDVELA
jgi:hypothetical protein